MLVICSEVAHHLAMVRFTKTHCPNWAALNRSQKSAAKYTSPTLKLRLTESHVCYSKKLEQWMSDNCFVSHSRTKWKERLRSQTLSDRSVKDNLRPLPTSRCFQRLSSHYYNHADAKVWMITNACLGIDGIQADFRSTRTAHIPPRKHGSWGKSRPCHCLANTSMVVLPCQYSACVWRRTKVHQPGLRLTTCTQYLMTSLHLATSWICDHRHDFSGSFPALLDWSGIFNCDTNGLFHRILNG